MQLCPLTSDTVAPAATPDPDAVETVVRTFCVVWQTGGLDGPRWKADVVADSPIAAAHAVAYDRSISPDQIVGVIDRSTIR